MNIEYFGEEIGGCRIGIGFVGIGEREDAEHFALCDDPDSEVTAVFSGNTGDKRRIDSAHSKFTVESGGNPFMVMETLVKSGASGVAFDKYMKWEEI